MKIFKTIPLIIVGLSFVVALVFYPRMPEIMVSHWGIYGQPDGFSSRGFGLFFMPILFLFMYLLFLILPKTDPYKKNFSQFEHYYDGFIIIIFAFLFYIYGLTIAWNLGRSFNLVQFLMPGFSLLFYYTGILTQNARRNWFVGFRTPWTMESETVWNRTHKLGGKLFKIFAIVTFSLVFFPKIAFFVFVPSIFAITLFIFAYSYYLYKHEQKK